jgi:hypothetical protein
MMMTPRWRSRLAVWGGLAVMIMAAAHLANAQTTRESKVDIRTLEKRLDEVLANQQLILQKLDAMMEELRIVKVRATN